jgi:hypothetical protein
LLKSDGLILKMKTKEEFNYNLWTGIATGFQIAGILFGLNMLKEFYTLGPNYKTGLIDMIILGILFLSAFVEELIIRKKFVR